MKIADFDFRIVKKKNKQWHCNNAECACNSPFIYGQEAFSRLSEFIDTDAEIELWARFTDGKGVRMYEGDIVESCEDSARYEITNEGDCFMLTRNGVLYDFGALLFEEGVLIQQQI